MCFNQALLSSLCWNRLTALLLASVIRVLFCCHLHVLNVLFLICVFLWLLCLRHKLFSLVINRILSTRFTSVALIFGTCHCTELGADSIKTSAEVIIWGVQARRKVAVCVNAIGVVEMARKSNSMVYVRIGLTSGSCFGTVCPTVCSGSRWLIHGEPWCTHCASSSSTSFFCFSWLYNFSMRHVLCNYLCECLVKMTEKLSSVKSISALHLCHCKCGK